VVLRHLVVVVWLMVELPRGACAVLVLPLLTVQEQLHSPSLKKLAR
jgi:hypothetical protein